MSPVRSPSDRPPGARTRTPRRRRALGTAVALMAAALTPALGPAGRAPAEAADGHCVVNGLSTTCFFHFTGATQSWKVPFGVTEATFEVIGAAGGSGSATRSAPGGAGGGVRATAPAPGRRHGLHRCRRQGVGRHRPGRLERRRQRWRRGALRRRRWRRLRRLVPDPGPGHTSSWSAPVVAAAGRPRSTTRDPSPPAGRGRRWRRHVDERAQRGCRRRRAWRAGPAATGRPGRPRRLHCPRDRRRSDDLPLGRVRRLPGNRPARRVRALGAGGNGGHFVNFAGKDCYELRGWGGGGGGGYFGGGGGARRVPSTAPAAAGAAATARPAAPRSGASPRATAW